MKNTLDKGFQTRACMKVIKRKCYFWVIWKKRRPKTAPILTWWLATPRTKPCLEQNVRCCFDWKIGNLVHVMLFNIISYTSAILRQKNPENSIRVQYSLGFRFLLFLSCYCSGTGQRSKNLTMTFHCLVSNREGLGTSL